VVKYIGAGLGVFFVCSFIFLGKDRFMEPAIEILNNGLAGPPKAEDDKGGNKPGNGDSEVRWPLISKPERFIIPGAVGDKLGELVIHRKGRGICHSDSLGTPETVAKYPKFNYLKYTSSDTHPIEGRVWFYDKIPGWECDELEAKFFELNIWP
jgi:hypothetical protein